MTLPRSVVIGGRPWPVRIDRAMDGAEWHCDPGEIRIGPHKSEEERRIWFLHEVLEAILTTDHCRYECYPDEDHQFFFFSHKELIQIVKELYAAIRPILK